MSMTNGRNIDSDSPKWVKHDYIDKLRREMAYRVNSTKDIDRRIDAARHFARVINSEYRRLFPPRSDSYTDHEFVFLGVS